MSRAIDNLNAEARLFFAALAEFEEETEVNVDDVMGKIDDMLSDLVEKVVSKQRRES